MMRATVALVVGIGVTAAAAGAPARHALPFIENDFEKAMAAAKSANRPIFVEVWAPW